MQQALAGQAKFEPECLNVLALFSPGLQKTTRFMISCITLSVLLFDAISFFLFFFLCIGILILVEIKIFKSWAFDLAN